MSLGRPKEFEAVKMNTLGFCHLIYSVLGIAQAFDQILGKKHCLAAAAAAMLKGRERADSCLLSHLLIQVF